jgi:hypothetical protein
MVLLSEGSHRLYKLVLRSHRSLAPTRLNVMFPINILGDRDNVMAPQGKIRRLQAPCTTLLSASLAAADAWSGLRRPPQTGTCEYYWIINDPPLLKDTVVLHHPGCINIPVMQSTAAFTGPVTDLQRHCGCNHSAATYAHTVAPDGTIVLRRKAKLNAILKASCALSVAPA